MAEPRPTGSSGHTGRPGDPAPQAPPGSSVDPDASLGDPNLSDPNLSDPSLAEPTISEQYGWLFRSAEVPADAGPSEDEQQTAVRQPAPSPTTAAAPTEPSTAPVVDDDDRGNRRVGVIIALAVVLVVALGAGALALSQTFGGERSAGQPLGSRSPSLGDPSASTGTAPGESSAPSDETPLAGPNYAGAVVAVDATEATADCQAPDAVDDAGAEVSYAPGLTQDGDDSTAWRCNGSGVGRQLTFTLPAGTQVAELGLVNGYAKTDPESERDRYGEYRRITKVSWILDGGVTVSQTLEDGAEDPQTIRIPVTESRQVVMRIDASTEPGSRAATRDAVLISEVSIGTPQ